MTGVAVLDYDRAGLLIYATTRIERELRAFSCRKEPECVAFLESIPAGGVLWDIGANVGTYSLVAASRGVRVIAVEPDVGNAHRIRQNADLNGLHVDVVPVALGDLPSVGRLTLGDVGATHSLDTTGALVPVLTVDQLVAMGVPAPQHIKCDVDGSERAVLIGAQTTLWSVCSVLVEVTDGSREAVSGLLIGAGLREWEAHRHERSGVTNLVWRR